MSKWIGVELEGTLAEYNERFPNQIGEPVNAMLLRVKGWLNEGKTVKVLSHRAKAGSSNYEVNRWLRDQGLSVDWPEKTSARIAVTGLHWRKPLPPD